MRIETFNLTVVCPNDLVIQFNNISRTAVKQYEHLYAEKYKIVEFFLEKVPPKPLGEYASWLHVTA